MERAPNTTLESGRPLDLIAMSSYPIADFYAHVLSPSQQPLVSVITPVYNGEEFLPECIESVLAQTYQNWDYTIVNNRSTDRTLEIAKSYAVDISMISRLS